MKRRLVVLLCLGFISVTLAGSADVVLFNGKIILVDAQDRTAQAVAIQNGVILKTGKNAEIKALAGPQCRMVDLQGRTVTPGLIDSHYHLLYYGAQFWPGFLNIRLPAVKNKTDLLRVVRDAAKELKPGQWVAANQGFHLGPGESLDRWDLDKVAPSNPCYLRHFSGQFAVVNSAALKIAGVDSKTPDPPSSKIMHNSKGEPTGVLSHYHAENLIAKYCPGYGDRSVEMSREDIERGQELCLQAGYTFAQDVIVSNPKDIEAYQAFAQSGKLKVRLYLMLYVINEEQARQFIKLVKPFKSDMLTFGGWKLAMDGGPAAGTTLLYDRNCLGAKIAYPYHSQEEMNRLVKLLHDTGLQVAVHVGGDEGIDMTLTAFEAAMKANPRPDPRHRIEHCLFPTTAALARMKTDQVILSTQPQWIVWHSDGYHMATNDQIMQNFLPLKTALKMGIPLAFGCDVPASPWQEPKWAFAGAVLRRNKANRIVGEKERLTVAEALRVHTMGSAYAAFREKQTGSLQEGKWADLTVWSHDLYSMKPEQLQQLTAVMTIVNGKIVYEQAL
jgi:predicted amidohydrolase YtcJ